MDSSSCAASSPLTIGSRASGVPAFTLPGYFEDVYKLRQTYGIRQPPAILTYGRLSEVVSDYKNCRLVMLGPENLCELGGATCIQ